MKYIKIFEEFIPDDVKKDIEDIFLELQDEGFDIKFFLLPSNDYLVSIKKSKLFSFSEISEEISRLQEYVESFKYELEFILYDFTNIPKSFKQLFEVIDPIKNKKNLSNIKIIINF